MFEVTINNKTYGSQEVESVSIYSEGDELSHAWVTFKKDVSHLVGLPIHITSSTIKEFTGQVDSVESKTEYVCKLYCTGQSVSFSDEKSLEPRLGLFAQIPEKFFRAKSKFLKIEKSLTYDPKLVQQATKKRLLNRLVEEQSIKVAKND